MSAAGARPSATASARSCTASTCRCPAGQITAIVGANACGKSTLLRAFARLLKPSAGAVLLDGAEIASLPTREVARRLGFLPQSPVPPEGLTVEDLVAARALPAPAARPARERRGPRARGVGAGGDRHRRPARPAARPALRRPAPARVDRDGARAGHADPAARRADDLPRPRPPARGARPARRPQRRRAARSGIVLHDLNHACRYAHHLVALRDGVVHAAGAAGGDRRRGARRTPSSACARA